MLLNSADVVELYYETLPRISHICVQRPNFFLMMTVASAGFMGRASVIKFKTDFLLENTTVTV